MFEAELAGSAQVETEPVHKMRRDKNVNLEPGLSLRARAWNFQVGAYGQILRKTALNGLFCPPSPYYLNIFLKHLIV